MVHDNIVDRHGKTISVKTAKKYLAKFEIAGGILEVSGRVIKEFAERYPKSKGICGG